jgi:hypothetical protein
MCFYSLTNSHYFIHSPSILFSKGYSKNFVSRPYYPEYNCFQNQLIWDALSNQSLDYLVWCPYGQCLKNEHTPIHSPIKQYKRQVYPSSKKTWWSHWTPLLHNTQRQNKV